MICLFKGTHGVIQLYPPLAYNSLNEPEMLYRLIFQYGALFPYPNQKALADALMQPANAFCPMVPRGNVGKISIVLSPD